MAEFDFTLDPETVEQMPTPAHLAIILCQNDYPFIGIREEDMKKLEHVPVYNNQERIGYVTYKPNEDSSVDVHIIDVENSQGNILTRAARRATGS